MTKHSFTASYKYQVRRMIVMPIFSICGAIVFEIILFAAINYGFDGKFSLDGIGFPCLDALSGLMLFIYGSYFLTEFMNAGAANGVSRTTSLVSAIASGFTVSATISLFVSVISPLINSVSDSRSDIFLLEFMYGEKRFFEFYGENAFVVRIRFFIMCTLSVFLCTMVGILFAAVFYRLSRVGTIIFAVTIVFLITFGYPVASVSLENKGIDLSSHMQEFFTEVGKAFGMAHVNGSQAGDFVRGGFMMLLTAVVMGFIAWLIVRRANAKPAAIRGE